jgi:hypothetical protein
MLWIWPESDRANYSFSPARKSNPAIGLRGGCAGVIAAKMLRSCLVRFGIAISNPAVAFAEAIKQQDRRWRLATDLPTLPVASTHVWVKNSGG